MIFGLFLLGIIFLIWLLFIKGFLFKLILFCFGWFGLYAFLWNNLPNSHTTALTLGNNHLSWAFIIPSIICTLTLLTTKG